MSAAQQAADLSARAKKLSGALWAVSGRSAAINWAADADRMLKEFARFLDRPDVVSAIAKATGEQP